MVAECTSNTMFGESHPVRRARLDVCNAISGSGRGLQLYDTVYRLARFYVCNCAANVAQPRRPKTQRWHGDVAQRLHAGTAHSTGSVYARQKEKEISR